MEQHPIPQQISSYQFKLVGDMTLKQFFQVAGGALVGLLFYATGLHPLIKWPLILISVGLGAAMAFLPFEERPLEKWIIAFFRSIYSPTVYTWRKLDKPPVYFTQDKNAPAVPTNVSEEYLKSTPQTTTQKNLETAERSFLSKLTSLWSSGGSTTPITPAPTTPVASNNQVVSSSYQIRKPQSTSHKTVSVPTQQPTKIPKLIVEEKPKVEDTTSRIVAEEIKTEKQKRQEISSKVAEFSVDAAPPYPPTIANTVTGQVIDQNRKIIAGTIMEIRDSQGRPVRALKSNMAGHFIIVTPLLNGKYEIKAEKEGYKFDAVSFDANGEIIPPIAIRGTKIEGENNENRTA